jgi:hypothetical protein
MYDYYLFCALKLKLLLRKTKINTKLNRPFAIFTD